MEKDAKEIINSQQKKSNENININIGLPIIECTYDIKDTSLVQIMNDRGNTAINEEVELKIIKGIENFNTTNVANMDGMFSECNELEYLDLSNFNTSNVNNMSCMFNNCNKLKYLNLLNFSINCATNNMLKFSSKKNCQFITNNKDLLKLYNSS